MARFDELDAMGDAIGKVYADCVDRLLVNIARHFRYLQPGEEPGGAFGWQARKLAELGQVNRENVAIIRQMLGDVPAELAEGLEQAIMDALADIEEPLRKAAEEGLIGGGTVPPVVDPRAMQAFQLYHGQSLDGLNLVNSRMLESTAEAYRGMVADITNRLLNARGTINAATGEVLAGVESFNRALELATRRLLDAGLTGFVDGGGRHWKPETYVAMTMRSTYHNVSRAAFWERNEEYANDLYLVSQHPGARPLCYPWQCKVISREDRSREEPDGDGQPVHVYAQSETTYGEPAGLFGINCGHHPELFIPGATKVPTLMQNEQENAETYALSQKQRKLEREFRKARLEYATAKAQGADDPATKVALEKLKRADDKLNRFEKETGRRRRREREYGPPRTNGVQNALTPSTRDQIPHESDQKAPESAQKFVNSDQQPPENAPDVAGMKKSVAEEQAPVEKPLTDEAKDDTLSAETKDAGDGVREIATIQLDKISARWGDGIDQTVVLSDERIGHIMERHPGAYEQYGQYVSQTIEQPDYILEDMKNANTAAFIRHVEGTNLNVIIKLAIQDNEAKMKSSVITLYPMSDKRLRRLINKSKVVYKSAIM